MRMKRLLCIAAALLVWLVTPLTVAAAGNVTYEKDAGHFIFKYGSEYSETDLFSEFKGVMPGDVIEDTITVRNDASHKVKVKIYMRSLGAHAESEDFLSALHLSVTASEDNKMSYMFDAAASDTAGLTDWVLLGTLYSGGEVNLDVTLTVPTSLDNAYAAQTGYLDWQFMVEEFPIESTDPQAPATGDGVTAVLTVAFVLSAAVVIVLLLLRRRRREQP